MGVIPDMPAQRCRPHDLYAIYRRSSRKENTSRAFVTDGSRCRKCKKAFDARVGD